MSTELMLRLARKLEVQAETFVDRGDNLSSLDLKELAYSTARIFEIIAHEIRDVVAEYAEAISNDNVFGGTD